MKLIISTIVGGIVLFLLGGLFYMVIFSDFFDTRYAQIMRSSADMKLWSIALGCLLQAFFLSFLYPKFYKSGTPISQGFKFGLYMGLLLAIPTIFFVWGNMRVPYQAAILDGLLSIVMITIAGIIIGLIYGNTLETHSAVAEKNVESGVTV